jgi:hypothetical protein
MKRFTFVMLVVCALAPATARANSGGFWDFLYGLDPKLMGIGTDVHLLCLKVDGERVKGCEEWWGLRRVITHGPLDPDVPLIKHEFNFRVAYYRKYGVSYEGVSEADDTSINAWKFMGMYKYHADDHIAVSLGAGVMPFYGGKADGTRFDSFSRVILTPVSVTYAPSNEGGLLKRAFYIRGEATFIKEGFSQGDFFKGLPKTETKGEWNFSLAAGFDLLRRATR